MHFHCRCRTVWARVLSNSCFGCRQSRTSYTLIDGSQEHLLLDEKVRLVDSTTTSYRSFPLPNPPTITQSPNLPASPPVAALSPSPILARPSSVDSTSHRDLLECTSCQRKSLKSSNYLGYDHKCRKHVYSAQDPGLISLSNLTPNPQPTPPPPANPSPPSPPPHRLQRRAVLSPSNYHADELPPQTDRTPIPNRAHGSAPGVEPVNELSLSDGVNLLGAGSALVGTGYGIATYYEGRNAGRKQKAQQADLEMALTDATTRGAAVAGAVSGSGQAAPLTGTGAGRDVPREPVRGQDFVWTGMK